MDDSISTGDSMLPLLPASRNSVRSITVRLIFTLLILRAPRSLFRHPHPRPSSLAQAPQSTLPVSRNVNLYPTARPFPKAPHPTSNLTVAPDPQHETQSPKSPVPLAPSKQSNKRLLSSNLTVCSTDRPRPKSPRTAEAYAAPMRRRESAEMRDNGTRG